MLKFITGLTLVNRRLHLAFGLCLIAAAFWSLPTNDAFMFMFIVAFGISRAHEEMAQALDILQRFAKRRASRHWPAVIAQVVRHQSYTHRDGSEDTERSAVSVTWEYSLQGQGLETQTNVFAVGKNSPEELARAKFPIGYKTLIHADPTGLAGIFFQGYNEPPSRWEIIMDLPDLTRQALLYLGCMGSSAATLFIFQGKT